MFVDISVFDLSNSETEKKNPWSKVSKSIDVKQDQTKKLQKRNGVAQTNLEEGSLDSMRDYRRIQHPHGQKRHEDHDVESDAHSTAFPNCER